MGKYGIRISQAGIPVDKAADYQKTMDERWPVLQHHFMGIIAAENINTAIPGVLSNTAGTIADVPVYHHGLGYLPAFRIKAISYSGFETFNTPLSELVFADEQDIYLRVFKSPGVIGISAKFFLAIVNRDCNQEFQAPIDIVTGNKTTNPSQYGLKIVKNNSAHAMSLKGKDNYVFNTNAKSMIIQQHGTRTASATTVPANNVVIDHRLGYPPSYYLARKLDQVGASNPSIGKKTIQAIDNTIGLAKSNSIIMTVQGAQSTLSGDFLFIVLKDPVDTAR